MIKVFTITIFKKKWQKSKQFGNDFAQTKSS